MVKHLFEKFEENNLTCLGENTEKCASILVELRKTEVKINRKIKQQINKEIRCYMKIIDSFRFMLTLCITSEKNNISL